MEKVEYVEPNKTMLEHLSSVIEQNSMIIKMNHDILKLMSTVQIVGEIPDIKL